MALLQKKAGRELIRRSAAACLHARHFHGAGSGACPGGSLLLASVPALSQAGAVKGKGAAGGGLLSFLFPKGSAPGPPMFEPLPGLPHIPPPELPALEPGTQLTTLDNGLIIASQDMPGATASVGVYVNCGSVWEGPSTSGASHLLERMAYKSTANRTQFRFLREIEAIGANCLSSASREQMAYSADVVKVFVPEAVELLADTVRNSIFNDWEVAEQAEKLRMELGGIVANNPQALLLEALHSVAFAGALSHPLMAHAHGLSRIIGQTLYDFVKANYSAPRMLVAGAGVKHEEFREVVEPLFSDMPGVEIAPQPPSQYVGGDFRMAADSPVTHVALGFEAPGGWKNEKDSITLVLLQALMGGGLSFSAGGPGKGMSSRLYKRVLSNHPEVNACSFFISLYNNVGIVGIHASTKSDYVANVVDVVTKEFQALASPGEVSEQDLQRAKNATVASVLMNLENRAIVAEDIGRQILTYGHRKPPQSFFDTVNSITRADVTALARKLLKSPLTFASYGDVVHVPRYDRVAAQFS